VYISTYHTRKYKNYTFYILAGENAKKVKYLKETKYNSQIKIFNWVDNIEKYYSQHLLNTTF
jgi:hypothetical protein